MTIEEACFRVDLARNPKGQLYHHPENLGPLHTPIRNDRATGFYVTKLGDDNFSQNTTRLRSARGVNNFVTQLPILTV